MTPSSQAWTHTFRQIVACLGSWPVWAGQGCHRIYLYFIEKGTEARAFCTQAASPPPGSWASTGFCQGRIRSLSSSSMHFLMLFKYGHERSQQSSALFEKTASTVITLSLKETPISPLQSSLHPSGTLLTPLPFLLPENISWETPGPAPAPALPATHKVTSCTPKLYSL